MKPGDYLHERGDIFYPRSLLSTLLHAPMRIKKRASHYIIFRSKAAIMVKLTIVKAFNNFIKNSNDKRDPCLTKKESTEIKKLAKQLRSGQPSVSHSILFTSDISIKNPYQVPSGSANRRDAYLAVLLSSALPDPLGSDKEGNTLLSTMTERPHDSVHKILQKWLLKELGPDVEADEAMKRLHGEIAIEFAKLSQIDMANLLLKMERRIEFDGASLIPSPSKKEILLQEMRREQERTQEREEELKIAQELKSQQRLNRCDPRDPAPNSGAVPDNLLLEEPDDSSDDELDSDSMHSAIVSPRQYAPKHPDLLKHALTYMNGAIVDFLMQPGLGNDKPDENGWTRLALALQQHTRPNPDLNFLVPAEIYLHFATLPPEIIDKILPPQEILDKYFPEEEEIGAGFCFDGPDDLGRFSLIDVRYEQVCILRESIRLCRVATDTAQIHSCKTVDDALLQKFLARTTTDEQRSRLGRFKHVISNQNSMFKKNAPGFTSTSSSINPGRLE
ncbi:hypothetical protein QS306_04125 [Paraburkholderia bonniea]|uniref:hypothetical protein n=1 Tax=Paraburkholderia bonniea TaxID=2152891 RepID=UPI0025744455|nr:hypothetical protein [Paraburkholderia bonniea]WJF90859.1 hypothetical protein QS306_04125 [Paraburkholderia bonniea]WJF94173.1 hypothetical protein QS308_04125 [Paraburkholderia bonniea]